MTVHNRLCRIRRGPWAREKIGSLLPLLTRMLAQKHPQDQDEVTESVEDALLGYLSGPERFDPCRGCFLVTWLAIQARGHLSHRLRKKQSCQAHEMAVGASVENFANFVSDEDREAAIYRGRQRREQELEEQKEELEREREPGCHYRAAEPI